MLPDKPLLNVEEVRPIFEVSKSTFYDWINNKTLPEGLVLKIGKTIKIRKTVLEDFLNNK